MGFSEIEIEAISGTSRVHREYPSARRAKQRRVETAKMAEMAAASCRFKVAFENEFGRSSRVVVDVE